MRALADKLVMPALLFAASCAVFWKLVLTSQYTWFDQPDFVKQVLPWFQFQAVEWRAGRIPLWDPYHWGGQSLIGQAQPGVAYPLNWLLFAAPLKDGFISQTALHWYFVLIHYLGSLFMYWLCRDLGTSKGAAFAGGIIFGLSGYVGTTGWPQMLNGAVWIPLLFLFTLRSITGSRPLANAMFAGASLGMAWLSGHHQIPIFMTLFVVGFALWRCFHERKWAALRELAVLGTTAGLISAVQTLPAYEYGQLAFRWVGSENPVRWHQKVPYSVHD